MLSDDQQAACERLTTLARVRASVTTATLPPTLLRRWSVPLLVGPAASGKEHVCQEVARRLGHGCCRRWEVASWITESSRSHAPTLDQIRRYVTANPQGCVIYLAGIDTLGARSDQNHSYQQACISEIERLLDQTSSRPAHVLNPDGTMTRSAMVVILGGRFSALWGEREAGGPTGADSWKLADREPLADTRAVSAWLSEHSRVPAGIGRRIAPEPFVLQPLSTVEAEQIAERFWRALPPAMDGIAPDELSTALTGRGGWRALTNVIEQALVSGYEGPAIADDPGTVDQPASPPAVEPPSSTGLSSEPSPQLVTPSAHTAPPKISAAGGKVARLGDRLSMPSHRSRLLPKARRAGLMSLAHLEALAVARGHGLPDEGNAVKPMFVEGALREEISNAELAVALLTPAQEYSPRALCRGALMLPRIPGAEGSCEIMRAVRKERAYTVIRHVALLGQQAQPQEPQWSRLLLMLPPVSERMPALPEGAMPDQAIRDALIQVDP